MIDIKFLRENPDIVKENIRKKFQDNKIVLVDEVIDLDIKNREVKLNGDNLSKFKLEWWKFLILCTNLYQLEKMILKM